MCGLATFVKNCPVRMWNNVGKEYLIRRLFRVYLTLADESVFSRYPCDAQHDSGLRKNGTVQELFSKKCN